MPFLKDIFDEYEILHEKFRLSLPHDFEDIIPLSLACIVFEEKSTLLFFVCQTFFKKMDSNILSLISSSLIMMCLGVILWIYSSHQIWGEICFY